MSNKNGTFLKRTQLTSVGSSSSTLFVLPSQSMSLVWALHTLSTSSLYQYFSTCKRDEREAKAN